MTKRILALSAALMFVAACGKGEQGDAGTAGTPGQDGTNGSDGQNGAPGTPGAPGAPGAPGTPGAPGADGTDGTDATVVGIPTVESCTICHSAGRSTDFKALHAITNKIVVSDQAATVVGADAVITFKITVDGVASSKFTNAVTTFRDSGNPATSRTYTSSYVYTYNPANAQGTRTGLSSAVVPLPAAPGALDAAFAVAQAKTVVAVSNGNYTVTLPGVGVAGTAQTFMIRLDDGQGAVDAASGAFVTPKVTVVAQSTDGAGNTTFTAPTNQACVNCHGDQVFHHAEPDGGTHHGATNPNSVDACVVCHVTNSASRGAPGDRLMAYVHGIHNSHNMPSGEYARSSTSKYSIGFPGYMQNCSTCHDTDANLAKVRAKPVTWSACMSCHDTWEGFTRTATGYAGADAVAFHQTMTSTTVCADCHKASALPAMDTVGDFHNGLLTGRNGLLWDGKDQSVELGAKVAITIDEITKVGTNLVVKWSAKYDGNVVDPCNTVATETAPAFFRAAADTATGQVAQNFGILRAYAQGNDWVNADLVGSASPGQPVNTALSATNTTCAANVATTTIPADTFVADRPVPAKGIVSLQGKPQIKFAAANKVIQVRAKSPTREFVVATGALPTDLRRPIVDIAKCQACHKGSIYQHGGNRVDSVDLCVTCHNPAANEKNNRVAIGITKANSYDGKAGEAYDFRTMIHAIHSAGETGAPLVYYRSNGVYLFGSQATIDAAKANKAWPGAGSFTVAGSSPATTRNHNEIVVHYPRALNDCQACHVTGGISDVTLPDPSKAVALTVDAGAAPWNGLNDDVLMGPVTASCMSCHQSGVKSEQSALRGHAYQNGWFPTFFENGRQSLLDVAQ